MDSKETEYYDYVIIGTGLTETSISSILSMKRKYKILQIDKNPSYGSDFATLQYSQLEMHFGRPYGDVDGTLAEQDRLFNIDITPKLLLQDSKLKDFLLEHEIQEMVNFTSVKESYFYSNKLHTIPRNETQCLMSSAVSITQKPKAIKFFYHVRSFFKESNVSTEKTMMEEFHKFGLNRDTMDFIGHAIALNLDDKYLSENPITTYNKIVRYVSSIIGYEGTESPYIYPIYGLSELCQSFARKSALNGALFMLNAQIISIDGNKIRLTDPNGEIHNISAGKIIADPKYFETSRVSKRIIRCIMIMNKEKRGSRNIIYLKKNLERQNDVFVVILGSNEMVCPPEYEIGILSTLKETEGDPELEISKVLKNYKIIRKYIEVRELVENDDTEHVIFTKGIDESALMDNVYDDIERIRAQLE